MMNGTIQPNLGAGAEELRRHLALHWRRASEGRAQEIESFFRNWDKQYRAIPKEKERNFPWPKASNLVVPVIRMYVDTAVDRTLNVIFKTRPLVTVTGYPAEVREALETYLNLKARMDWKLRRLARGALKRGHKYGTALVKVFWREDRVNVPLQVFEEGDSLKLEAVPTTRYEGPWADHIAFDDWFVYPMTANEVEEVEIFFHRLRYPEEVARRKGAEIGMTPEEIERALKMPADAKREQERRDTGVDDHLYREMHLIECHFDWEVQGSLFRAIALFEPETQQVYGFELSQIPPHVEVFHVYRPSQRDDVFQGESTCQILGPGQEEISSIHNERRNLSTMASAPIILKKEGVRVPGAGNNVFYPGKVYTVEDMDDFRVEQIGGNYQDMIAEENHSLSLQDRVSGISAGMQASSQGGMGKGGVYNTQGTMAVMAEGNQRQDTMIGDFREFLGGVVKAMFALQCEMNPNDPAIEQLPPEMREKVRMAMQMSTPDQISRATFEVNVSDAAMNREARKSNLMTMANTLSQFAGQAQQLAQAALNPTLNPVLKQVALETLAMQHGVARALIHEFDLHGLVDSIPNAKKLIDQQQAQQQAQQQQQQPAQPGGMGQPPRPAPPSGMGGPPGLPQ